MKSQLVMFLLLANPAIASHITCDVKLNQENHFKHLENGKIVTDLNSGIVKVQTDSKTTNLIEEKTIGSIKADKSTCEITTSIDYESDGSLKGYKFYYVDCIHPKGEIITITNSFTVKTNRGVYQEAAKINGNYIFNYFFIENCKLNDSLK